MKAAIRYHAAFRYAEPVSFSPHTVRLIPRVDQFVKVGALRFEAPGADVQMRRDLFDNLVAACFFPAPQDRLEVTLHLGLELQERNPFHFLLAPSAIELPVPLDERERAVLAPFLGEGLAAKSLPMELRASHGESTVAALVRLCSTLHGMLGYERREEGEPLEPLETIRRRRGSCRDFTALFAAILRGMGLGVRLVSGFLWEPGGGERRAENALHAWVEVYLPGAGWVGIDPTNGVFADHHRIATAVGLTPADIAPVVGHYYGDRTIPSTLEAQIEVTAG